MRIVQRRGGGIIEGQSPKGVWCFFHSEDLSPIELHGGRLLNEIRKLGRLTKPLKRSLNDYPLAAIKAGEPPVPYITEGEENGYKVVTVSFYYKDNPASGVGWQARPRDRNLGYHPDDIEFVSIYYTEDGTPEKVYFSQHSIGKGEGVWRPYKSCQFRDGYLVVYVARNSHACFPTPGTQVRVFGFANDVTERGGPNKAYPFSAMTKSYDWDNGHGIRLYKNLRPTPPGWSMSQEERILRIGKRRPGLLPPQARTLLSQVGSEPITSLMVLRTPLSSGTKSLLGLVSFGTFENAVQAASYDDMFHLALLINTKYTLDKQEVVKLQQTNPTKPNTQSMVVPLSATVTIQQLVDRTKQFMGDVRFSGYDAKTNNCQDFIQAVLQASNLLTPPLQAFIKQDASSVFQQMPSWTAQVARAFTDIGAVANRVIQGENLCGKPGC